MSSEQHRMVILVNTETGYAYPTKNNNILEHINSNNDAQMMRRAFYTAATAGGGSMNYQTWSGSLRKSGYENFFAVVIEADTESEVKQQVLKIINDNRLINARKKF